jgi:hypothetical protein
MANAASRNAVMGKAFSIVVCAQTCPAQNSNRRSIILNMATMVNGSRI